MSERLRSWRSALDVARCPREYMEVDRLAIEASTSGFSDLFEIKSALRLAKRRMGIDPSQGIMAGNPEVVWTEHLIDGLAKSIDDIQACQNTLWDYDVPVCSVTKNFEISAVSRPWCQWFGYEACEVIGATSVNFLTDESRRKAERRHARASKCSGVTENISYDLIHKGGSIVPVKISSVRNPIHGDAENWRAFVTFKPRADLS